MGVARGFVGGGQVALMAFYCQKNVAGEKEKEKENKWSPV